MTRYSSIFGPMPGQAMIEAFIEDARELYRPKVVNVSNYPSGVKLPGHIVYIGRGSRFGLRQPSPWANIYHIPADGNRAEVIAKFEVYARERLEREPEWLAPLRGKSLACHCKPLPCHGAVILALLKERYGDDD
jgi:hypothetical protein